MDVRLVVDLDRVAPCRERSTRPRRRQSVRLISNPGPTLPLSVFPTVVVVSVVVSVSVGAAASSSPPQPADRERGDGESDDERGARASP